MRVVAGIDIGNSTTEVVLLAQTAQDFTVVGSSRAMTRGVKGSRDSVLAAARLVRRAAARLDAHVDLARVAPWHPVRTACRTVAQELPDTGCLRLVTRHATTAAGDGVGVGRPVLVQQLESERPPDPTVVLVGGDVGYAHAARWINDAERRGADVVGVLVERDEAVLVANRLDRRLPVIDQVRVGDLVTSELVALEARPGGQPMRSLSDPFWLASTFGLGSDDPPVVTVCRELEDASFAVVARGDEAIEPRRAVDAPRDLVVWRDGSSEPFEQALERLRGAPPGSAVAVEWADGERVTSGDAFAVALSDVGRAARTRRGTLAADRIVSAILDSDGATLGNTTALEEVLEAPVAVVGSEAEAGRSGALSTPGAPGDAVVVDLGGGTIDVTTGQGRCIVAGAGDLLTRVTAEALGVPTGTAEYAKRGPALHLDAPQVAVDEIGGRSFLDRPAPGSAVGALCVQGPVGLVPFNRTLGLGEWRAWRTTAKTQTIGDNVARALAGVGVHGAASVILVGGAAGDDEAVAAVSRSLPTGSTIGRGNVAGTLGHRFAVAYGLALGGHTPR